MHKIPQVASLEEFLGKLNYLIRVDKTEEGLKLTFKDIQIDYKINPGGFIADKEYKLPPWALRMGVLCHILNFSKRHLYKSREIAYYNSRRVDSLADLIDYEEDFKENLLCTLIADGIENEFSQIHYLEAEEFGVLEEFKKLVDILEK